MNSSYTPLRRTLRLALQLLLLVAFIVLAVTVRAQTTATVSTDQPDYPPGSTAYISGSGFLAGETVTLQVLHDPTGDDDATSSAHQPWTVTADDSGNISSSWLVPADEDEAGATLKLSAIGQTSGATAVWVFTDALPTITALPASGSTNGSYMITLTASSSSAFNSGGSPYTVSIGGKAGSAVNIVSGSQLSFTAPAHAAGTVTITVLDKRGNAAVQDGSFTYQCPTITFTNTKKTYNGSDLSCNTSSDGQITINTPSGGTSPYSYSDDGGVTFGSGNIFSGLAAGIYNIVVKDANSCVSGGASVSINAPSQVVALATITQALCHGDAASVVVTATGGTGSYTGTGTFSLADGQSTTYTVKDANGCSATSNSVTATSPSQVVVTVTITQALCHGDAASVLVTATGGTGSYTGTGTFSLADGQSATYTVKDSNGCSATSNSVSATSPSQVVVTATITQALCHGDAASVVVTATGGTGSYTGTGTFSLADGQSAMYTVKDSNGCSATSNSVTATSPSQVIVTATITQALCHGDAASVLVTATGGTGSYTGTGTFSLADGQSATYNVKDANGCSATSNSVTATSPSQVVVTATITQALCHGDAASVLVTATGGTGSYTGTGIFSLADGQSATYTVKDSNGCSATSNSVTAASPSQVVVTATITQALCHGDPASVVVTATGGTGSYTGTGTFSLADGQSATYNVKDANGCSATSNSVTATSPSQVVVTATITQALCHGDAASVVVTAAGGTGSYTGTGTFSLADGQSGTYTVKDANGCSATSNSVTATSPSQVVVTATITQALCHGDAASVVVAATGGTGSYTGTGTFSLADGQSATYPVKDSNGCLATSNSVKATSPSQVVVTATTNNARLYFGYSGDQTATITGTATGGTGPYTIRIEMSRALNCNVITSSGDELWNNSNGSIISTGNISCPTSGGGTGNPYVTVNGSTYSIVVVLMADADFTVTVTDAKGCTASSSVHVDAEDVRCFGGNSTVTKVTLCHKTGSIKNPCVTLCVDQSAVNDHLSHGDFLGACTSNCTAPAAVMVENSNTETMNESSVETYPNPFRNTLSLRISNPDNSNVQIGMFDITGKLVPLGDVNKSDDTYTVNTEQVPGGFYILKVGVGSTSQVIKVIKE